MNRRFSSDRFSDFPIHVLLAVIFLSGIGILALYSIALNQPGTWYSHSYAKQLLFLILALSFTFLIYLIPLSRIYKSAYWLYSLSIIAICIPFFLPSVAGTHRWITFGGIQFQPSEYAKIFTVIAIARYLSDRKPESMKFTYILPAMALAIIPTAIVAKQPDLGTAIIIIAPLFPLLFWSGAKLIHLFLFLGPVVSILTAFHSVSFTIWGILLLGIIYLLKPSIFNGAILYFSNLFLGLLSPKVWSLLKPYQQDRILTFLNPEKDPLGAAYQIIQSQTAIGSGGLFGKGLGQGTQTHLKFLPVQESDFILSVIGEELGFIIVAMVLVVFAWLILRTIRKGYQSKDRFTGMVLLGFSIIILAHVFVNTAMTVGMIPVKGLPLPFISYGGSFLLSTYMMMGFILQSEQSIQT